MKKSIILASIAACLFVTSAFAGERVGNVKVSLIGTILSEYKVAKNVTVGIDYGTWKLGQTDITNIGLRGYWYPDGALNGGLYLAGTAASITLDYSDSYSILSTSYNTTGNTNVMMFGAVSGYQWMWDHFNINTGVGYHYAPTGTYDRTKTSTTFGVSTTTNEKGDLPNVGGLTFDLHLGYAF